WAPVTASSHAAARPVICHGPGPPTDSSCCCQARNLPWAPVPASSCCCQVQSVSMGPCTASHCCCLYRHTLPCATFRSPHTAGGFHFCHRVLHGLPLLLPSNRHTVAPHSGFGPVTGQMSEVCGVILRSTAFICMSYCLTVLFLFPSRLQGHLN
ncbi:unnamed protein product, partial [Staurois parvus]